MSRNPYVDLCLHLQALRRQAEEVRTPLAPAIGVAGLIYTHQVANVLRVLTDVRVRHLLADEVGLGKTVQALMVLNALRRQRKDLRAMIVVPDRLVPQWRDELMTRAHTAPYETQNPDVGQYVRLAWEDQLGQKDANGISKLALTDIDPTKYQVLIVDELHRLRSDLQDHVVRVSTEFEHILILTATPSFQLPERHAQLFAVLEPERTTRARWEIASTSDGVAHGLAPGDNLSKWPAWASQRLVESLLERDRHAAAAAEASDTACLTATAMAMCAYRRVIRTRRVDYSGVLPRRRHRPIIVEPLGSEVDRQALMWRYFGQLDDLSARFDPVLLAKRVILSPPSLEQRVDFFRRKGHERDGILEQVKPLVHRSNGDSRADALVDLLAGVWTEAPEEQVLVAAQDNLTVDYLFDLVLARLPEVGPLDARVPLVAARVRQGMATDAVDDLSGFGNETNVNLEAFQQGKAQLLLAPEAAQVGLNLQCARVLVLYSVPWKPEEVEQWIGRLDRIGNVAAFSNAGKTQPIDIYTIAQRGLVDEKVVTVLQRFHVFERTVNLDGAHLGEVAQLIEDAALRPQAVNWRELEDRTGMMAAEDAIQELHSVLRPHLPWDVHWATAQRNQLDSMVPVAPVLSKRSEYPPTGPIAWDRALEPMFQLLEKAGEYSFRGNKDPETERKFRSLWYRFGERGMYGQKPVTAKVVFTFGADPAHFRNPRYAHAFITRRGDIGSPPCRQVMLEIDNERVRRPLRFVSFGDALHDEIVDGWAHSLPAKSALVVTYFDDHDLWKRAEPGWFLLRVSTLDPADSLGPERAFEKTMGAVAAAATHSLSEHLMELFAPFSQAARCSLEADERWLRATLNATAEVTVRYKSERGWQPASEEVIAALVNPMAHNRNGVPRAVTTVNVDSTLRSELDRLRSDDLSGLQVWSSRFPKFAVELSARLGVLAEEARDAIDLAERDLTRAVDALSYAEEHGNRAQVTRSQRAREVAFDVVAMTRVYWDMRIDWLRSCEIEITALRPRETLVAAIQAQREAT